MYILVCRGREKWKIKLAATQVSSLRSLSLFLSPPTSKLLSPGRSQSLFSPLLRPRQWPCYLSMGMYTESSYVGYTNRPIVFKFPFFEILWPDVAQYAEWDQEQ